MANRHKTPPFICSLQICSSFCRYLFRCYLCLRYTKETTAHAIRYFLQAFAILGIPQETKSDTGPSYLSHKIEQFFNQWRVIPTTGIAHSPTGQSIVERAHGSLKSLLDKHKGRAEILSNTERLSKALYAFYFLNHSFMEPNPPIIRHFSNTTQPQLKERPAVLVKDPETNQILGPFQFITWGKGYSCVSTDKGPCCIPAKTIQPYL